MKQSSSELDSNQITLFWTRLKEESATWWTNTSKLGTLVLSFSAGRDEKGPKGWWFRDVNTNFLNKHNNREGTIGSNVEVVNGWRSSRVSWVWVATKMITVPSRKFAKKLQTWFRRLFGLLALLTQFVQMKCNRVRHSLQFSLSNNMYTLRSIQWRLSLPLECDSENWQAATSLLNWSIVKFWLSPKN